MAPRLVPSLGELERLATPLNHGEQKVLERLVEILNEDWYLYVQPHLLNMHPDFLLVSPGHGVTVIEVKDWQDGGHRARGGALEVRDPNGNWVRTAEDPIAQAHRYRGGVRDRFVATPDDDAFRSVRSVVVLPRWSSAAAGKLLRETTDLEDAQAQWIPVVGREFFEGKPVQEFTKKVVWGGFKKGNGLSDHMYSRLLGRLEEPESIAEQRQPLRLSDGARDLATNPNNAVIRRVRGPAGSGKTLGLAARAAVLAKEGKSVLILSFNITLAHYVQGLVRRQTRTIGADHRLIDCIHIHGFCTDAAKRARVNLYDSDFNPEPSSGGQDGDVDDHIERARKLYETGHPLLRRYDAVLVDEGQDFKQSWWNFLRNYVREDEFSEMVLAADGTQDIYDRKAWVDEPSMKNCGFSGRWATLKGCYRLPVDLIPIVSDFASGYVKREVELPVLPSDHSGTAAEPTVRRWRNAVGMSEHHIADIVEEEVEALCETPGLHYADVVVLVNEHQLGVRIADRFPEMEHIFAVDPDPDVAKENQRRRKMRFYPGVARMKGCTVHSFKGWESRALVVVTAGSGSEHESSAVDLAYVALSRVKGDPGNRAAYLTVVNTVDYLEGFKPVFERTVTIAEVPQLGGQGQLGLESEQ